MDKPLAWLVEELRHPPFSRETLRQVGVLLRRLQAGERLQMPHSRSMSTLGRRCHELRVRDRDRSWRIVYRVDPDAVVIVGWFAKKTRSAPARELDVCRRRLRRYDE